MPRTLNPLYLCLILKVKHLTVFQDPWVIMKEMGFCHHVVDLISKLYHDQECAVRTSSLAEETPTGLRLEEELDKDAFCTFSFQNYAESIMRKALEEFQRGVKFGRQRITNLRYADDTILVCSSKEELLELLGAVKEAIEKKGLLLNSKKTKIMVPVVDDRRKDQGESFMLNGNVIEEVGLTEL